MSKGALSFGRKCTWSIRHEGIEDEALSQRLDFNVIIWDDNDKRKHQL